MARGKKGTRNSYAAVSIDFRNWARSKLHTLGRGRGKHGPGYSRSHLIPCTRCHHLFELRSTDRGWRCVLSPGELETFCPAAVFGYGDGI